MLLVIVAAGLFGGFVGAGVLPALVGGIGQPGWLGLMALVVAMAAWTYIGGCLALPALMLAFSLAPILIGIGVISFGAMMVWSTMRDGRPSPFSTTGTWTVGFNDRVEYNLCAAGTSLITLGNMQEIGRKCKQKTIGAHPVEGRFAGIYSCRPGQRIAAIVSVRPMGSYRDGTKAAEFLFSDRPESAFPIGEFAGLFSAAGAQGEFRSTELKWMQKPGADWGKPDGLSIAVRPDGGISVKLLNTPCATMQARRCAAAEPGGLPSCETEFAQLGVKLYRANTMKELNQVIAEEGVRRARAVESR